MTYNKNKHSEYCRIWKNNRRAAFFKDKYCKWCGSTENLVLHHIDPKNKTDHKIWSWSEQRREDEIKKCIVICEKCHIEYHANLMRTPLIHGTRTTGYLRGCRCNLCRNAQRLYMAEWRKNKTPATAR